MIVLNRFRVPEPNSLAFRADAERAIAVLREREGFVSGDLGLNIDDPQLWTITTRWRDVGSYRRALNGFESKTVVVPLLSLAIDEPSAYEYPDLVGDNEARGSGPLR